MLAEIWYTTYHLLAAFFGIALAFAIVVAIIFAGISTFYQVLHAIDRAKRLGAAELMKDKG